MQGTAFTFPKQVGFILSTLQNRITQLMFPNCSIVLESGNPFNLVEVLTSSYGTTDTDFGDISGIVKKKTGESKNQWIENMAACRKFDITPVNATCFYYSVFDTYSKFMDTNSSFKKVPRKNSCD